MLTAAGAVLETLGGVAMPIKKNVALTITARVIRDQKPRANAVRAVKTDHHTAARKKERRGPTLSTYHPATSWHAS